MVAGEEAMTDETALVVAEPRAATVFGTDDPSAIVRRVSEIATPLAQFIHDRGMTTQMGNRVHVNIEGWSFMGQMLGVAPVTTRVSELRDAEGGLCGFEAHVELRTRDGSVVGAGIGECSRSEAMWGWHPTARDGRPLPPRDDFALKSMAQTRAAGKAYRMAFGFIMQAAGYDATPAEEMPHDAHEPLLQGEVVPPAPRTNARSAPAKPEWAQALDAAMKDVGLTQAQLSAFLQTEATYAAVQDWMTANKGNVHELVALAMPDREPAGLPF